MHVCIWVNSKPQHAYLTFLPSRLRTGINLMIIPQSSLSGGTAGHSCWFCHKYSFAGLHSESAALHAWSRPCASGANNSGSFYPGMDLSKATAKRKDNTSIFKRKEFSVTPSVCAVCRVSALTDSVSLGKSDVLNS